MSAQLRSLALLGFRALFVHPVRLLVTPRHRRGRERFIANYVSEGLIPLANPDPAFMRCIGCGLCDLECPLAGKPLGSLGNAPFLGPSVVARAWTRATPDLTHVASSLERLPDACGSCRRCEEVCPTRVPLNALFVWANEKLDETRRALSPDGLESAQSESTQSEPTRSEPTRSESMPSGSESSAGP